MNVRWIGELRPDPAVRGVVRLAEKRGARKLLRDLSTHVALDGMNEEAVFEVMKQRLGERAMIRIRSAHGASFHVKLTRIGGGERRAEEMNRRADLAELMGAVLPRAIAYLPRFRALVMPSIDGAPILEDSRDAFAEAGAVLSRIHAAFPKPLLERGRAFEYTWLAPPGPGEKDRSIPKPDPPLLAEIDRWKSREPGREIDERFVTLHGDFYPEHVLVCGRERIAILDWDNICAGEAERDVGNFVAHLILEEERETLPRVGALAEAFCDGYESPSGARPLREELLAWYTAGSLLRLAALHRDPAFGSRPPNDPALSGRLVSRAAAYATAV